MMKVAYVFPRSDLGGAEIATLRIVGAHDRSRYAPVGLLLEGGPLADRLVTANIPIEIAPFLPRIRRWRERREIRAWMRNAMVRHNAAIQHAVMAWTHVLAAPVARTADTVAVWFQHNHAKLSDPLNWLAAMSHADLIIANSRFVASRQRSMNPRRVPIEVVRPPVSLPKPLCRSDGVRRELGADSDTVLVVLPGRLQRPKGQDVAIRALAAAVKEAPQIRLAIVGGALFGLEHDYRTELEALAAGTGVSEQVCFAGFRDDMAAVYSAADVVLSTSRSSEAFGLAVAEGLAHGRLVIASDVGGVGEQIRDGVTGILVPAAEAESLARALVRVTRDPSLRERMGSAAAGVPPQTPASAARQIERLYDRMLEVRQ